MMLVADVLIAVLAALVALLLLTVSWLVCELADTRHQQRLTDATAEARRLRARQRRMQTAARAQTPASPFAQLTTPWTMPELPAVVDTTSHTAEQPIPAIPAARGPVWPGTHPTTAVHYGHPRSN